MNISQMIDIALAEDVGPGDITTQLIFDTHMISTAYVIAKQDGIICGIDFFCDTMTKIDESIEFDILKPNGSIVKKNDHVIKL
ncbi:MAG: nicotinate-nucleotide diphosphorylase (carboxylating), partial [Calditrichaeota bacterium]|nr:nicotinate-nucleotide diphosphorylase (carboxylating) [Calditrichota bacterium]